VIPPEDPDRSLVVPFRLAHACLGVLLCLPVRPAGLQDLERRCLEVRSGGMPLRVLQFGDSHTAFPGLQREFTAAFQGSLGSGGLGFGLPWVRPMAGLRCQASGGWRRAPKGLPSGAAGLENGWLEASVPGETASVEGSFTHVRVHFQSQPGGGTARILADGQPLGEVSLAGDRAALAVFERALPPRSGSRRLEVVTTGPGAVRILGLALEDGRGSVDSFVAYNGFQAAWLLDIPEDLFAAQLRAERPDLVTLAFGTNEANDPLFDPEKYRQDLGAVLTRFQRAAPQAAIALLGPPDARLPRALPGALESVIAIQREAAAATGAWFWDQRAFMGGPGSIEAWNRSGFAREDRVHFTREGYQRLARGFLDGLSGHLGGALAAASRPAPVPTPVPAAGGDHPIYVFKTLDGRTLITDDPAVVAGERGEWVGRAPQ
jgi:hypothetical protein